jgi:hypothetical protein
LPGLFSFRDTSFPTEEHAILCTDRSNRSFVNLALVDHLGMGIRYYAYAFDRDRTREALDRPFSIIE